MSDRMKMITALGFAGLAGLTVGHAYPERTYEKSEESKEHKRYRSERRNKKRMQKKSKKANRT